jgi:ABC-type nitrate/sulfonate/bicarbonate transport system substrate-binding protein
VRHVERGRLALGLLAVAAVIAACTQAQSNPPPAPSQPAAPVAQPPAAPAPAPVEPAVVRVGSVGGVQQRGFFVGEAKGFYAEQGITLDWSEFRNAAEMLPILATGRLDAGVAGPGPAYLNAHTRGVGPKLVADVTILRPPGPGVKKNVSWVVVRKAVADEVKTVADLKGRKVVIVTNTGIGPLNLERVLTYGGLQMSDVQVEVLPYSEQLAALSNGAVDAALTIEPMITLAEDRGIGVGILDIGAAAPNIVVTSLYYGHSLVSEQPELGKRFMVAHLKSLRYIEDAFVKRINWDDVVDLFIKNTELKNRDLYERMGVSYNETNARINLDDLEEQQEYYVRRGEMESKVDLQSIVDTRFAEHAIGVLGPYQ